MTEMTTAAMVTEVVEIERTITNSTFGQQVVDLRSKLDSQPEERPKKSGKLWAEAALLRANLAREHAHQNPPSVFSSEPSDLRAKPEGPESSRHKAGSTYPSAGSGEPSGSES